MEDEKILFICEFYREKLDVFMEAVYVPETYKHLLYMLWQIPHFIKEGRKEKANRWLGFVQGALWANDIYTIEEMKDHNRPDEKK
jgi:hypothetical protein